MRALITLSILTVLAAGCASRGELRALQAPPPLPQGMIRFENDNQYRGAVAIMSIGGVSRRSYFFAEPNQRMIRPILEDALAGSGLRASAPEQARYGLRVVVTDADGPMIGTDYETTFEASYVIVDRRDGREIWRRDISTPGVGQFLAVNEADWEGAWYVAPVVGAYRVANPLNYFPFASDSAAERARRQGPQTGLARAEVERNGSRRAARANHTAVATNVSAFLAAFASDNGVAMIAILPCGGSQEAEARRLQIMASGGDYATADCVRSR